MDEGRERSPEWLAREAGALLTASFSLFLLLALWSVEWTGNVGSLVARPLVKTFGQTTFLLPVAGLVAAIQIFRHRATGSTVRWAACLGIMIFGSILAELIEGVDKTTLYGGVFGDFLVRVLGENFGMAGSYLLVVPLFLLCLLATTATSIRAGLYGTGAMLRRAGAVLTAWRSPGSAEPGVEEPAPVRVRHENLNLRRERSRRGRVVEVVKREVPPPSKPARAKQETFSFTGEFRPPPLSFLDEPHHEINRIDRDALEAHGDILQAKLEDFGIQGEVESIHPGPIITTYEFKPAPGVKVSRIVNLADDLSMALRAMSVRILAPIPGKSVVGIEVSNPKRDTVYLREIFETPEFQESPYRLPVALGKDSVGHPVVGDLTRMPHLLVAGATGTGKSVALNAMITSILYKASPDRVRLLMIDPKMLELSLYEGIPHLLTRVVIDPKEAVAGLDRAVKEMQERYRLLRDKGVRDIDSYNRVLEEEEKDEGGGVVVLKRDGDDAEGEVDDEGWTLGEERGEKPLDHRLLPYIVVIIDELADLMMIAGKQVEEKILRLAQKARAAGIHLIAATQRPSVDVITGLIKANFPARMSFQVTSRADSKTILDSIGAERLLGNGDMLFMPPATARLVRVHGPLVTEREVAKVTGFLRDQGKPKYDEEFTRALDEAHQEGTPGEDFDDEKDTKYEEALDLLGRFDEISTSKLQRYLKIGYNRAARMIERMEHEGLVGPADGAKPREVLRSGGE